MQIQREDLNPCTVQLEVVCDPEEVKEGFSRAFKEAAKQIRIPGFRPGHAPRAMVEQRVSKDAVAEVAAEIITSEAYKKAIKELDLQPYTTGAVTVKSLDGDENKCELTMKVPLKPVVEIGDYSSIPVERPEINITDEDVEQQFEDLRRQRSTREAVSDRGLVEGDVAVVNVKVTGEEGEGRNFMVVAGKTFAQMDAALIDMKVEDMKHLELAFPDGFQEKDWAGKTLSCQLTLRSLSAVKLPDVEDLAQSLKFENVDELKKRIRELIEERQKQGIEEFVNEQLIEALMQRSSVCVPDTMWESVAKQKLQDLIEQLSEKKVTFADYVKEQGMTEEQFVEAQQNEAKTFVMRAQLIQDLYLKEDMKVTEHDLMREVQIMAKEYNVSTSELLQSLQKNNSLREVNYQAIHRKVMEFLQTRAESKEVARV